MANKILHYLSAVQSECEENSSAVDYAMSEADDGESSSADEGRRAGVQLIDRLISDFQKLRVDMLNDSHKEFCRKHGIDETF